MDGGEFLKRLKEESSRAVEGMEDVEELLAVALLARGHVLLEGVPGMAKTTVAKTFASATGLSFSRVQLTPDLMPADITGSAVYDQRLSDFKVRKGPIFANVVLADEINRATPKTQSALLEAMQEGQTTIERSTFQLEKPFMVIATMNPVEAEGVYPLPEAQKDRFMMRIKLEYMGREEELSLLRRKESGDFGGMEKVVEREELHSLIEETGRVEASEPVLNYIYSIALRTRSEERVILGASPRACEHLLFATKARAFLRGRSYVLPDDVKFLAPHVLNHRLKIKAEHSMDGLRAEELVEEVLEELEVPK